MAKAPPWGQAMLSLDQCRKILDDADKISDQEIELLRNDLYSFAEISIQEFISKKIVKGDSKNVL